MPKMLKRVQVANCSGTFLVHYVDDIGNGRVSVTFMNWAQFDYKSGDITVLNEVAW
jgi:hypothetical protein